VASSDAVAGTATAGEGAGRLFVRQTSGLVRELGIPAAIGISLASVAVVNTFINFNAGLTDFAKADMYLPLIAAAIIWLVAMFAYRHLLRAIPRAGGEYVYLSRIVSRPSGPWPAWASPWCSPMCCPPTRTSPRSSPRSC
jgi:amino acid transporter